MIKKLPPKLLQVKKLIFDDAYLSSVQSHIACLGITLDKRLVGYRFICVDSNKSKLKVLYLDMSLASASNITLNINPNAYITGTKGNDGIISSEGELSNVIDAIDVSEDYAICNFLINKFRG